MKKAIEQIKSNELISIQGSGTRGGFGELKFGGQKVLDYAPSELRITVEAGMTVEALEGILAENNQILPFEPMDHRGFLGCQGVPTIGGALGVNADGPRRLRYGSMRDSILGLSFIDGQGEVVRTGGIVMKNVTGLDLTRFFTGSRGRLGLATQLTLKLLPKPKEVLPLIVDCPLAEFETRILPLLRKPYDIVALSWFRGQAFLRLEGVGLTESRRLIEDELGKCHEGGDWHKLSNWHYFQEASEVWRLYCRPSKLLNIASSFDDPLIQNGGSQIIVAANESIIKQNINQEIYAIREKGGFARWPLKSELIRKIGDDLIKVFDPMLKFGGQV